MKYGIETVMNPKVDGYFKKAKKWRDELDELRAIVLDCELAEELKWGKPCYTFQEKNVVLIIGFKEYCALLFTAGALLKDASHILIKPGENTQAARQVRFTGVQAIAKMKTVLKAYICEAVEVEKSGLKVNFIKPADFVIPGEFQHALNESHALKAAFDALTPGRQRAYLMYFSAPKQSNTRVSRIEKCIQKILDGQGLNDR